MPDKQATTNKMVIRSAGVMSSWTTVSRISGLVRDMLSAPIFGTSMVMDMFVYAFMVPNFLRRLFAEGALSSAFIPIFTEYVHTKTKQEAFKLANIVLFALVLIVSCIILLGMAGGGMVLNWFTLSHKTELFTKLLIVLLPYLLFVALSAWAMGILNSFKHFFLPAVAPTMLNVGWIAGLLLIVPFWGRTLEEKIFGLAIGVLVGGLLQFLIQVPGLLTHGFRFEYKPLFSDPGLKKIGQLMTPAVFGLAITQLNMLVDMTLGWFLPNGAISALWYGNRLVQLPIGVFGVALGTAVLPFMSEQSALNQFDKLKQTLVFALKMVFLITIPAAVGLIVLRVPIVRLIFERGEFKGGSTQRVAGTLLFYSLGLFAYTGGQIVVRVYYSLKDTLTPVKIGVVALLSNIVLNIILMQFMQERGLAFATSISSTINFVILLIMLRKKIGPWPWSEVTVVCFKVISSSLIMAMAIYLLSGKMHVLFIIPIALVVFIISCLVFKVQEAGMFLKWMLRKN